MIAGVIVVINEAGARAFEITGKVVVFKRAVTIANEMVRIAWVLMARGGDYRKPRHEAA